MKQVLVILLLCIVLAGCASPAVPAVPMETEPAASLPSASAPTPAATEAATVTYTLYLPNENADGFITRTVQTSAITAESVLAELQQGGALPADGITINAFGSEGDQLNIDFNQAFADAVNAMGTSGEYMIVGSVVNTFLNAFQARSLTFTVEGQILESGHVIYDFPLTFHE